MDNAIVKEQTIAEALEDIDRTGARMHAELYDRLGPVGYWRAAMGALEDFITSYMTGIRGETDIVYRHEDNLR